MSDLFSPLPFDEASIDPQSIIDAINDAADTSDELTGRVLEAFGAVLENLGNQEAKLTARVLEPVVEGLRRANQTQNELFGRIGQTVVSQVGQIGESMAAIEDVGRRSGVDLRAVTRGPDTIIDPSNPFFEEGVIAVGGAPPPIPTPLDEGPPPETEPEITPPTGPAIAPIEPSGEPPVTTPPPTITPPTPPTITPPPQVFPPGPQQPPQPRPIPQPQPQPIVITGGGGQCSPTNVQVVCPSPLPEPQPQPGLPVEEDRGDVSVTPGEALGEAESIDFCSVDAYAANNATNILGEATWAIAPFQASLFGETNAVILAMRLSREANAIPSRNILRSIVAGIRISAFNWANYFDRLWGKVVNTLGSENAVLPAILAWRGLLNIVSMFFGPAVKKTDQQLAYMANSLKQVEFPDANETVEAFVRGEIDEPTLKIWVAQNDKCWEPFKRIIDSRIDRVEPLMALQMFKRRLITEDQFKKQVRKAGYTQEELQKAFRGLEVFIPPITDLIRYMVRDVEDSDLVAKFGMDDEFEKKWTGKTKHWGEQQGIPEDVAKNYWRAHWRIPSPTQLFDMFHRSRHLEADDPLKTTMEDVRTALKQDDLLPAWIDRLINTTFRRLSRVDARRAFETGAIDEAFLRNEFSKLGYEPDSIDALVKWAKINKLRVVSNLPEMRLYRDGLLGFKEAKDRLADTKLSSEDTLKVLQLLETQRNKRFFGRCVSAIRKRYLTGELDELTVKTKLQEVGLSPDGAREQFDAFECEKAAQGKHPSTSQLCQWLEEGSITSEQMVARLQRIGWQRDDAVKILISCQRKINERQLREAEKLAKQEAAALEKSQREQEAEQRKLERARLNADKQREKLQRAKANREKLLQRTIAKFANQSGLDVGTSGACVQSIERSLAGDTLLTTDERIQTIVVAVERLKPVTCEQLRVLTDSLAIQLLEFGELTEPFLASFG